MLGEIGGTRPLFLFPVDFVSLRNDWRRVLVLPAAEVRQGVLHIFGQYQGEPTDCREYAEAC